MRFVRHLIDWSTLTAVFSFSLALCTGIGLLAGCGGESGGAQVTSPPPKQLTVPDGTFDVATTLVFNTCATMPAYDQPLEIRIIQSDFFAGTEAPAADTLLASWIGTWNAQNAEGFGESERLQDTLRQCTSTTWTTIHVKFSSEDDFTGEIVLRTRLAGACGQRLPCSTTWHISGTRQ